MICQLRAIPFFLKTGLYIPHVYVETERYQTNVFATKNGFRESSDYLHAENEESHLNATVIVMKCKYCGKKDKMWFDREPRKIGG